MISDWSKASLHSMQEAARRDDVLDMMVPSDLRVLLMRYAEALNALKAIDLARHTDAPGDWTAATALSDAALSTASPQGVDHD